jgi:methylthioribose-1-phosphate isomerase
VQIILDSAIALAISNVDIVLSGAEAVVENGGIINKVAIDKFRLVLIPLHCVPML